MARPVCPHCGDNFSVARLSALCRNPTFAHAATLRPTVSPRPCGQWIVIATIVGLFLCAATLFTWVWLAMAFCLGVCAEMFAFWEHAQAHEPSERMLARWKAAYYCGTHDCVFLVGERTGCSPEEFALLLSPTPATAPLVGPGPSRSQPPVQPLASPEPEDPSAPLPAPAMRAQYAAAEAAA